MSEPSSNNPCNSPWTEEIVSFMKECLAAGYGTTNVARFVNAKFGTQFSAGAVSGKAGREGISLQPIAAWPQAHIDRFAQLYHEDNGLSFSGLAAKLNEEFGTSYTRNACIGKSKRLGLSGKVVACSIASYPRRTPTPRQPRASRPRLVYDAAKKLALSCVAIEPRHLALVQLQSGDCRYPYGDDPASMTYCGHPVFARSWCAAHFAACYLPPKKKERRAA